MLIEFQSIIDMMHVRDLGIEHESTAEDVNGFLIKKKAEKKRVIYTKNHLKYLVKRMLKEFNGGP